MRDRVRLFAEENCLLNKGDRVIVALSGGADSVALLHVLISLKEEYSLQIYAAHFHHGIRGKEADRDMAFAESLCKRLDVPIFCERADVPAAAAHSGESLELCGRKLRYGFFDRIVRGLGGGKLATAHHRDDNAETVLLNLTRGAGLSGLGGIPVKRDNIIRPLLCVSRGEIEAYCEANGLDYVNDSTNLSDDYTRNRLRHQVMPVLRELNPSIAESINHTSALMREADAYLGNISLTELNNAKTPYGYSCEALLQLPGIILKYAVKKVVKNAGAPVDFRHIALIIEAMSNGGTVELGQGYTAACAQGILRVISDSGDGRKNDCVPFSEYIKTHGTKAVIRGGAPFLSDGTKINNLLLKDCIPCDIISCDTVLRTRRAGDSFTDARRGVTKSLKKLMNELKIPRELRDSVPVVAEGSVILWLSGYGTSKQAAADFSRDGEIIIMGE